MNESPRGSDLILRLTAQRGRFIVVSSPVKSSSINFRFVKHDMENHVKQVNKMEFSDLPAEIKEIILAQLNRTDQMSARTVCREWTKILEREFTLKFSLDDSRFQWFKNFDENKRIDQLIVKSFQTPCISKSSTRSGLNKNIRSLVLGLDAGYPGDTRRDPNSPYTYTRNIHIIHCLPLHDDLGINPINMRLLIEMNPGIEALTIGGASLYHMVKGQTWLKNLKLDHLTVLDINFGNFLMRRPNKPPSIEPYMKVLQNFFPSLHTLKYSSTVWKTDFRLWVAVLQCVATHRRTLKHLKIFHTTVYSLHKSLETSGKWFPAAKYEELLNCIRQVQLDTLSLDLIKCGPRYERRWKDMEAELVYSQRSLTDFVFMGSARDAVMFNNELVFHSIQNTISTLEIYWHCLNQPPFDCTALNQCKNLKSLKLNIQRTGYHAFDPSEKVYLNINKLPTGIVSLLCGQLINDVDVMWISKNMLDLEDITFANLRHVEETRRTLEHLLMYLYLPKLRSFRINNFNCPRIFEFVERTPGLSLDQVQHAHRTFVCIDRKIFRPMNELSILLFQLI